MNPLFPNSNNSNQLPNNMNPFQIMEAMKNYQGTPEQAKAEFFKQTEAMGMSQDQVEQTLSSIKDMAKMFGF